MLRIAASRPYRAASLTPLCAALISAPAGANHEYDYNQQRMAR